MASLEEILGIKTKTENTIKKIDFDIFKQKEPYLYQLVQENISNLKEQYNIFCNIVKLDVENYIYHKYLYERYKQSEYVYFIKNDTTGLIKIGITTNPHARIIAIKTTINNATGVDNKLRYIGIIRMTSTPMQDYEKSLHKKYALYKQYGEWFNLSEEHIIKTYFSNSYEVNGIPFVVEIDNRGLDNIEKEVPDTIWEYIAVHQIMKSAGIKYREINTIENPYLEMYIYCLKYNLIQTIVHTNSDDCINTIMNSAKNDI